MLSRDRVIAAICHEEPDRVPIFDPYGIYPPTADKILGRPCVATHSLRGLDLIIKGNIEKYREIIIKDWYEIVEKNKFDAGPILKGYSPVEGFCFSASKIKIIEKNTWKIDDSTYRYIPESGVTLEIDSKIKREGLSAFEEYVKELKEESDEEIEESILYFQDYDEYLSKLWKKIGVLIYVDVGQTIPIDTSWFTIFLKSLYLKPNIAKLYLKEKTRRIIKLIDIAKDFGAELFYIGGDVASKNGPIISPKQYHDFILPEIKIQVDFIHKKGLFAFNSSDGNLWPIIEDFLINSGVDGMMEIQTTAGMDLNKLKDLYGDRICFQGGVDCQYTLVFSDVNNVIKETKKAIDILSIGGGHILSSSNSIHPGVKPENFFAMIDTARKYGIYNKTF